MTSLHSIFNNSSPVYTRSDSPAREPSPSPPPESTHEDSGDDFRTADEASPPPPPSSHSSSNDEGDPDDEDGSDHEYESDDSTRQHWGSNREPISVINNLRRQMLPMEWAHHQNLPLHLINSFHLKRRYPDTDRLKYSNKRQRGIATESPSDEDENESDNFMDADETVPWRRRFITKQWAAWPQPADIVPREAEHRPTNQRRRRYNDTALFENLTNKESRKPTSGMLEEVLVAQFVRQATARIRAEGLQPELDDERSEELLRPVVRHVVQNLEGLLAGLGKERAGYMAPMIRKEKEFLKKKGVGSVPEAQVLSDNEEDSLGDSDDGNGGKNHRRRSGKAPSLRLPSGKKRRQKTTAAKAIESIHNRRRRVKLRDWSQVLGVASMQGWDQGAVQRTTERCSKLFNEDMQWRSMNETDGFSIAERTGKLWSAKSGMPEPAVSKTQQPKEKPLAGYLEEVRIGRRWRDEKAERQQEQARLEGEEGEEEEEDEDDEDEDEDEEKEDDE